MKRRDPPRIKRLALTRANPVALARRGVCGWAGCRGACLGPAARALVRQVDAEIMAWMPSLALDGEAKRTDKGPFSDSYAKSKTSKRRQGCQSAATVKVITEDRT